MKATDEQCSNASLTRMGGGAHQPHQWFSHVVVFGFPVVWRCRLCGAKRWFR